MSKLIFARHQSGRVVHVAHVASGLACDCICLDCGERLMAKKGPVRDHHFAHSSGAEHDWVWETHLHAYAKQLILDAGALFVPLHSAIAEHLALPLERERILLQAGAVPMQAEVSLGRIRPDLLLHLPDRQVSIAFEVRVTHACDEKKVAEFKRQQLAVLEIDLRKFPSTNFQPSKLREAVLDQVENKIWLWPVSPPNPRTFAHSGSQVDLPKPVPEPKRPPSPPQRFGVPPALPPPAMLRFPVPAWKAIVTVEIQPQKVGAYVLVHGMQGGIPKGQPEMATPRILRLVEEVFAKHAPWAKRARSNAWYVEDWDAALMAEELAKAAQAFCQQQIEERRRQEMLLAEDFREARERAAQYHATRPPAPARGPGDNPYARRKG